MTIRYGYYTRNVTLDLGGWTFFTKTVGSEIVDFTSVEDVKQYIDEEMSKGWSPWQFEYKIVTQEDYIPIRDRGKYRAEPRPGGPITDIGTPPEPPVWEDLTG